jgi:hypothetical protein
MVKVVVNGRTYDLELGRRISYIEAVRLAYNKLPEDTIPEHLTVTFRYKRGRSGTLTFNGPSVPAAKDMVINVSHTDSA